MFVPCGIDVSNSGMGAALVEEEAKAVATLDQPSPDGDPDATGDCDGAAGPSI
jgi:hypothetical protein